MLTDADDRRTATGEGLLVRVLVRNRLMYDGHRSPRRIGFWTRYRARLVGIEAEQVQAARVQDEGLRVGEILLLEVAERSLPAAPAPSGPRRRTPR